MNLIKKTAPLDYVKRCQALARDYLDAKKAHTAGYDQLTRDYKGDLLREKRQEHQQQEPDKEAALKEISRLTDRYRAYLDELQDEALDGAALCKDFALLSLPVKLTTDEIQRLHDKNADNPLFCRALQEYHSKQGEPDLMLDLRDSITARRELINFFSKDLENSIRQLDFEGFGYQDTLGHFENIEKQLEGDGLWRQPQMLVEEDENGELVEVLPEEVPQAVDPAGAEFLQGFAKAE